MQSRDVQRPALSTQTSRAAISSQQSSSSQQMFEHDSVEAEEGFQLIAPHAAAASSPSFSLSSSSPSLSSSTPSLAGAVPAGKAAAKRKKRAGNASPLAASVTSLLHDRDGAGSSAILMSASAAEAGDAEQGAAWAAESHYAQYSDSSWSVEEHSRRPVVAAAAHLASSLGSSWSNSVTASQQLDEDEFDEAEQPDDEEKKGEEKQPAAAADTQQTQQAAGPAAGASPRATSSSVYPTLAAFTTLPPLEGSTSGSATHRSLQSYSIPALPAAFSSSLPHRGCSACGCAAAHSSFSSAASCCSSSAASSSSSCSPPIFPYLSPVFLRRAGYVMSFLLFFSLVKLGVSYATRCCNSKSAVTVAAAVSHLHS
jgi:hypothetical protein